MTLKLVKLSDACPEQYHAYDGDKRVGYLRLRHGVFRVDCPDVGETTVYFGYPKGDGIFDDEERDYFLRFAVDAIQKWQKGELPPPRPKAPEVEYILDKEGNDDGRTV